MTSLSKRTLLDHERISDHLVNLRFLERLGLREDKKEDKELYAIMKVNVFHLEVHIVLS